MAKSSVKEAETSAPAAKSASAASSTATASTPIQPVRREIPSGGNGSPAAATAPASRMPAPKERSGLVLLYAPNWLFLLIRWVIPVALLLVGVWWLVTDVLHIVGGV